MPRLALGERRALEIALHGAPTEPDLLRDGVQRPPLPMVRPDLLIVGPPLGPPLAAPGVPPRWTTAGGASGTVERLGAGGRVGGIVHAAWARRCAGH